MRFTIVTPSYNQLDWLRLCVASVADQVGTGREQGSASAFGAANGYGVTGRVGSGGEAERDETGDLKPEGTRTKISIEHIVRDAGTPGIEEFAREMGARFYREGDRGQGTGDRGEPGGVSEDLHRPRGDGYSLTIYSEKDEGMYDAINKGLCRASGEICAYLNCDEQYLPGALRWVADYFSISPRTDVLFGAAIVTRADGSYVCDRRVMVPTRWHTMVSGNLSIFTSSTFFRRKPVVEGGLLFDPQWRVCGDAVWALRFLEAGLNMEATHKPLSAFTETGVNMSAVSNPRAAEESRRLALSAPAAARALKPAVLLGYRLRRWWSGAYALQPHQYSIYTSADTQQRRRFNVDQPAFRWQMRAELG